MGRISVSDTRDYFLMDGERFFYLADTWWSGFTNPTLSECRYYLDYRRMQGFNALQINIFPQHDRSESANYVEPFEASPDGGWNFHRRNEEYFDRAERIVEMLPLSCVPVFVMGLSLLAVKGNPLGSNESGNT
ncbi:MAG: DUF4038 domain-containing protein [Nitrososphaerota archaeon]